MPDRIEIVSYPGPDRSITDEGLRTYHVFNRRYRNRRIGEFLKEKHLTEGRNTGFRKILNALERNGSPNPIFETDPDRLSFATTLFIHPYFLQHNARNEDINEEINEEINIPLTEKETLILIAIKRIPSISLASLVNELAISKSSVERALQTLRQKGIINRVGSRKNGKWMILCNKEN